MVPFLDSGFKIKSGKIGVLLSFKGSWYWRAEPWFTKKIIWMWYSAIIRCHQTCIISRSIIWFRFIQIDQGFVFNIFNGPDQRMAIKVNLGWGQAQNWFLKFQSLKFKLATNRNGLPWNHYTTFDCKTIKD